MPDPQFVNPVTGEIIEVKSIERWDYKPMFGWYRVFEEDGSTIAYVPDMVTAKVVSVAFALLTLFQMIDTPSNVSPSVMDSIRLVIEHAVQGTEEGHGI